MLLPKLTRRKKTYGFSEGNHYRITRYEAGPKGSSALVEIDGTTLSLELSVPGRHNILNATAALAVGMSSISPEKTP